MDAYNAIKQDITSFIRLGLKQESLLIHKSAETFSLTKM